MKHYLNDIPVSPRNILEIGLITDYTGNPNLLQIDSDTVVLPREANKIILDHVASQGVFEGIPYRIETEGGVSIEYYVDLTEGTVYRDFEVEVKIKKRQGFDNFNENSQALSFELMNTKGVNFDFIDIPYLIIPENQVELGITLSIATYVMTKESIQATKDLVTTTRDLIEALTLSPFPEIGEIVSLGVAVAGQLIYTLSVYNALIKLARQMRELIFPKVRTYKGATIKELIKKGCEYLGYTLDSDLLNTWDKLTLMPVPLIKDKKGIFNFIQNDLNFSYTKGYLTAQDTVSTLGELISAVEIWFNARTKVYNGVVQIERRDYWANITSNTTVPALNLQGERQSEYKLNTEEAWKRSYIHYQVDYADTHTLDFFDPTDAEFSTEPLNVINEDLVSIRGLNDINIPFALGVRKSKLSYIESFAKGFFQLIDTVTGFFGAQLNTTALITNRLGVTQISQQYYSITKVLLATNGRQSADYVDKIKAGAIYEQYHKINEININGYKIYSDVPMRLKSSEFVSLLDNNFAYINGVLCEILSIRYIDELSKAIISYKEPFEYAKGKVDIIVIND
tara:strand:+ start:325 stop:2028 length:1704 start_codon:yes stop_codon:yes gene_type:complete